MRIMTRVNYRFEESIRLAKVKAAYGMKGELFILPFTPKARWIYDISQITLVKDHKTSHLNQHKPFKSGVNFEVDASCISNIEYFKGHKDGYIVKLEMCSDRSEAEKWNGAFVSVPISNFTSQPGEEIYLIELKGFTVVNLGQQIGPIVSFSSNGYQDLIQVRKDERIYDIPFVKEFLVKIDWEAGYVYMNLPEGLLDEVPIKSVKGVLFTKKKSSKSSKKKGESFCNLI